MEAKSPIQFLKRLKESKSLTKISTGKSEKEWQQEELEIELLKSNIETNLANKEHRRFMTIITVINIGATIATLLILLWRAGKD